MNNDVKSLLFLWGDKLTTVDASMLVALTEDVDVSVGEDVSVLVAGVALNDHAIVDARL